MKVGFVKVAFILCFCLVLPAALHAFVLPHFCGDKGDDGMCINPPPECTVSVDLLQYFIPDYPGWQNASQTWETLVPSTHDRTYSYPRLYGKDGWYAYFKFDDPSSGETYAWDRKGFYLTSENGQNGSADSRRYLPGLPLRLLGLLWMPRYGCLASSPPHREGEINSFYAQYNSEVHYSGCDRCPCEKAGTAPMYISIYPSTLQFVDYDYGTLGVIPTLIKVDPFGDGSGGEAYYYGLGHGLLRFEAWKGERLPKNFTAVGQVVAENFRQTIKDEMCFHPDP